MIGAQQPGKVTTVEDPKCLTCQHRYSGHREDNRRCKTIVRSGWDEKLRRFTQEQRCDCKAYRGPIPAKDINPTQCPHECLDGSRVCVICKKPVPVRAKK